MLMNCNKPSEIQVQKIWRDKEEQFSAVKVKKNGQHRG